MQWAENNRHIHIDVYAFLDSILDICFVNNLEINIPSEGFDSYFELFSIIAHRCPKLKSLTVTFYSNLESKTSMREVKFRLEDFNLDQVTHRLNHLETLNLLTKHPHRSYVYPHGNIY